METEHTHPSDTNTATRETSPGTKAAPWVSVAMTILVLTQLRHLETTPEGSLVWNGALGLVVAALAVNQFAVWRGVARSR